MTTQPLFPIGGSTPVQVPGPQPTIPQAVATPMTSPQSFTLEQVSQALPAQFRGKIDQDLVDELNKSVTDPEFARMLRDNMVSYTSVLKEGRFKIGDYLSAVAYVSYKLMGESDREAYVKTFPDRYLDMVSRNVSSKDIASYIAAYNRGLLVNKILQQTMIPTWVLNQDVYQNAINVQASLMVDQNVRADVRQKAADSILNHLKRPEASRVELSITERTNPQMEDFREQMREMVANQQKLIRQGEMSPRDVAHQELIKKTVEDVEDAELLE